VVSKPPDFRGLSQFKEVPLMTRVEVVNRQVIGGKERKKGEVIDVSPARARDLINESKARPVEAVEKPAPAAKEGAKNG
jgi:hypothetical protein